MQQLSLFEKDESNSQIPEQVRRELYYERGLKWYGNFVPEGVKNSGYEIEFLKGMNKALDNDPLYYRWYKYTTTVDVKRAFFHELPFTDGLNSADNETQPPYIAESFRECWYVGRALRNL